MFRIYEFWFFLFFCSLQEDRSLYRMTSYLFYVLNAEQWNVFVFLEFFKLNFNFQKSCLCYGVPYIVPTSICTTRSKYVLFFVLIAVIRCVIIGVFWFLNLSFLFWKDLTWFLRLLSAVCFRDIFQIRIMNYLRAIDNHVRFFRLSVFYHFKFVEFFNVTKRFQ